MPSEPLLFAQPPPHSASSEPNAKMNRAAQPFSASERSSNPSTRNPAAATSAHSQSTAAPQRAAPFGEGLSAVSGQRQAAFRQHAVEAFVGERQSRGVGDDKWRRVTVRADSGGEDDIDADRRDAALVQQTRRGAEATADVGDFVAGAEVGAINQFPRQRQAAGTHRLACAVTQRAAAEQPVSCRRRAEHHLSSSACSTFSMRPRASSSET